MNKTHLYVTVALSAALGAIAFGLRAAAANPNPAGTWLLAQIQEADGTVHTGPVTVDVKYVIDTVAQTVTNEWYEHGASTPFDSSSYSYTIQQNGNWYFATSGPVGASAEFSLSQPDNNHLTLTCVNYSGSNMTTAPAAGHRLGTAPPLPPGTKPVPSALFLAR